MMEPFLAWFRSFRSAAALFALISGSAILAGAAAVDQARLDRPDPANWLTHGGTYAEQRFSALRQIDTASVRRLGLAWSYAFDTDRGQEATPLAVDGVIYVSTAWSKVYAIDGRTGKRLWAFDPRVEPGHAMYACCDVVNRGVAVWKGRVFVGMIDGRLIAIDAATGKQVWSVQTVDRTKPYTITGAPRVFRDKVVIGNGGAELGVRGYITAYDTATGKQVWRFYTVPGDPAKGPDGAVSDPILAKAVSTWAGHWYDYGGGGTVWDSIVYDQQLNQLYVGVGNGSPWPRSLRSDGKGDNLFLGSILALDPDTGRYLWHYQETPGDSWDFTSAQQITLATLKLGGADRQVILHAPKNGFFYVIDRHSGKVISAKNYVPVTWADGVDPDTGRPRVKPEAYYAEKPFLMIPSSIGGHNWPPMSYSPQTGLVYIPAMQTPTIMAPNPEFHFTERGWNIGTRHPPAPDPAKMPPTWGALIAWDPVAQREAWRVPQADYWNGGTLATAGNLVFEGTATGEFDAFDATNGRKLWQYKVNTAVMAGPISYRIGKDQYVAVMAGSGGFFGLFSKVPGEPQHLPPKGRLLVFKLDGHAPLKLVDEPLPPPNPPAEHFADDAVARGRQLYFEGCSRCHGGHVLPDLRRSGALADAASWKAIVVDQALRSGGMAPFWIDAAQAEDIRAYMAGEARKLEH
jgi:quinohemoprotein ethanol dehydrogenase